MLFGFINQRPRAPSIPRSVPDGWEPQKPAPPHTQAQIRAKREPYSLLPRPYSLNRRVPLDKVEGFVKAQISCAVREHRDVRQRG